MSRIKSIFDMTPQEQMATANAVYDIEMGRGDIFSLRNAKIKKKKEKINHNGLTSSLEREISNRMLLGQTKIGEDGRTEFINSDAVPRYKQSDASKQIRFTPIEREKEVDDYRNSPVSKPKTPETVNMLEILGISIKIDAVDDLYRIVINDHVAPTSFYLFSANSIDIANPIQKENAEDLQYVWNYIISLKHPTAIFKSDEFNDVSKYPFGRVTSYNKNAFLFIDVDDYVLCYYINEYDYNAYAKWLYGTWLKREGIDPLHELTTHMFGLAYACGTLNQVFMIEDEWYLEAYYNSKFNHQNAFLKLFTERSTIQESVTDETESVEVYDADELQGGVREFISSITGTDYYDEDEDDDEDDEDEDNDEEGEDDEDDEIDDQDSEEDSDLDEESVRESEDDVKKDEPVSLFSQDAINSLPDAEEKPIVIEKDMETENEDVYQFNDEESSDIMEVSSTDEISIPDPEEEKATSIMDLGSSSDNDDFRVKVIRKN